MLHVVAETFLEMVYKKLPWIYHNLPDLDRIFLASSYSHSFHFTALTAKYRGVQTTL